MAKYDQEQLVKFIQSLLGNLAFFVRAGNPSNIASEAKMVETYAYRSNPVLDCPHKMSGGRSPNYSGHLSD